MKSLKTTYLLFTFFLIPFLIFSQDSLLRLDLSKHIYHFEIKDNKIVGDGAELLKKEIQSNQYFLLGEYHGSPGISNLTQALIPIMHDAGYRNFGIEVGPSSVEILKEFSQNPSKIKEQLHAFNTQYLITESDGYKSTSIPFFDNIEDAAFLEEAANKGWNLIGLDQEYYFSFIPLLDRMFQELSKKDQATLGQLHQEVKDSILHFYKLDDLDKRPMMYSLKNSKPFQSFLQKATAANNKNKAIETAIQKTIQIYGYNEDRKYYDCNRTRIEYMKENLKKSFDACNFNLSKDKFFLKMGGVHTAKGMSWLSLYELGNTLSELAAFHQNNSIHITFHSRYYMEDGKVTDTLADTKSYGSRYRDITQFADKDQWTIIDLRPLKEKVFYSKRYKLSDIIKKTFAQHDLILIPKLEGEGTPNYKK